MVVMSFCRLSRIYVAKNVCGGLRYTFCQPSQHYGTSFYSWLTNHLTMISYKPVLRIVLGLTIY